jgi:hypothetical protein
MQSISNGAGFELKRILRDKYTFPVPVLAEPRPSAQKHGSAKPTPAVSGEARESTSVCEPVRRGNTKAQDDFRGGENIFRCKDWFHSTCAGLRGGDNTKGVVVFITPKPTPSPR